jgi:hypothetical protein
MSNVVLWVVTRSNLETSVSIYKTTRRHNPEEHNRQLRRSVNLKSQKDYSCATLHEPNNLSSCHHASSS